MLLWENAYHILGKIRKSKWKRKIKLIRRNNRFEKQEV